MKSQRSLLSCEEWHELYKKSRATTSDIVREVGIPKSTFLKGVMINGKGKPIPFEYEKKLHDFLSSRVRVRGNPYPLLWNTLQCF